PQILAQRREVEPNQHCAHNRDDGCNLAVDGQVHHDDEDPVDHWYGDVERSSIHVRSLAGCEQSEKCPPAPQSSGTSPWMRAWRRSALLPAFWPAVAD